MHSQSADVFLSCTQGDNNFHLLLYSVDSTICVSVCVHVCVWTVVWALGPWCRRQVTVCVWVWVYVCVCACGKGIVCLRWLTSLTRPLISISWCRGKNRYPRLCGAWLAHAHTHTHTGTPARTHTHTHDTSWGQYTPVLQWPPLVCLQPAVTSA